MGCKCSLLCVLEDTCHRLPAPVPKCMARVAIVVPLVTVVGWLYCCCLLTFVSIAEYDSSLRLKEAYLRMELN